VPIDSSPCAQPLENLRRLRTVSRQKESEFRTLSTSAVRKMSKSAFVARVSCWAKARGISFSEARLNEWIKQKLVTPAERQSNEGQRPTYAYGCAHYRRSLQLVRLWQAGITDVDALQVQLFLRGYAGVTPKLRRATENEFRRAKGSLNPSMRSTYLDRLGPVTEGRRRSILRSLGKPDPQLGAGGYVPSPEDLIALVRASRSPGDVRSKQLDLHPDLAHALPLLRGLMAPADEAITEVDRLIRRASDEHLISARAVFWFQRVAVRKNARSLPKNDEREAFLKLDRSWLAPNFAVTNFVVALRLVRQNLSRL
jgi:hypothetical protein